MTSFNDIRAKEAIFRTAMDDYIASVRADSEIPNAVVTEWVLICRNRYVDEDGDMGGFPSVNFPLGQERYIAEAIIDHAALGNLRAVEQVDSDGDEYYDDEDD